MGPRLSKIILISKICKRLWNVWRILTHIISLSFTAALCIRQHRYSQLHFASEQKEPQGCLVQEPRSEELPGRPGVGPSPPSPVSLSLHSTTSWESNQKTGFHLRKSSFRKMNKEVEMEGEEGNSQSSPTVCDVSCCALSMLLLTIVTIAQWGKDSNPLRKQRLRVVKETWPKS